MPQTLLSVNPFAMLLDPQAVVAEMERSERLAHLKSRVFRPLDRPLIPKQGAGEAQAVASASDDAADDTDDVMLRVDDGSEADVAN